MDVDHGLRRERTALRAATLKLSREETRDQVRRPLKGVQARVAEMPLHVLSGDGLVSRHCLWRTGASLNEPVKVLEPGVQKLGDGRSIRQDEGPRACLAPHPILLRPCRAHALDDLLLAPALPVPDAEVDPGQELAVAQVLDAASHRRSPSRLPMATSGFRSITSQATFSESPGAISTTEGMPAPAHCLHLCSREHHAFESVVPSTSLTLHVHHSDNYTST